MATVTQLAIPRIRYVSYAPDGRRIAAVAFGYDPEALWVCVVDPETRHAPVVHRFGTTCFDGVAYL